MPCFYLLIIFLNFNPHEFEHVKNPSFYRADEFYDLIHIETFDANIREFKADLLWMVLVVIKLFCYIHDDLWNYSLSILKWIWEIIFVPVSKFFDFIIQNEVKFILSEKFSNVLPEQVVILFINLRLSFDLFKWLKVSFELTGVISIDITSVNQFKLCQVSCCNKII